jgi:hypothetical protein
MCYSHSRARDLKSDLFRDNYWTANDEQTTEVDKNTEDTASELRRSFRELTQYIVKEMIAGIKDAIHDN